MTLFKMTLGGTQDAGDQWTSGLHFEGTETLAAAAVAWELHCQAAIDTLTPNWNEATTVMSGSVYSLDAVTGLATGVLPVNIGTTGSAVSAQLPPRDAIVIGMRTTLPGPGGRGRMFLPAPAAGFLGATGLLTFPVQGDFATAFAALLAAMVVDGLTPVLVGPVVGGLITTPIVRVTVGRVLGSQRRRTNKIPASYISSAV